MATAADKTQPACPKHLLDVNVLISAITSTHALHARAFAWIARKQVVL